MGERCVGGNVFQFVSLLFESAWRRLIETARATTLGPEALLIAVSLNCIRYFLKSYNGNPIRFSRSLNRGSSRRDSN